MDTLSFLYTKTLFMQDAFPLRPEDVKEGFTCNWSFWRPKPHWIRQVDQCPNWSWPGVHQKNGQIKCAKSWATGSQDWSSLGCNLSWPQHWTHLTAIGIIDRRTRLNKPYADTYVFRCRRIDVPSFEWLIFYLYIYIPELIGGGSHTDCNIVVPVRLVRTPNSRWGYPNWNLESFKTPCLRS